MKISEVIVYDLPLKTTPSAGRQNPYIVEIRTDEGIYGAGEIGLSYGVGGCGAAHIVIDLAEQFLIGKSPDAIEALHDTMIRKTFWGMSGGAIFYAAVAAIDECLWDIKGKALSAPVYELLGGRCRSELRLYANGWYRGLDTPGAYAEAARKVIADGYTALKFDPFKADREGNTAHPRRHLPHDMQHLALERVAAVREAVGDANILVEFHGNLWPSDAIRFGERCAQYAPMFYEEPVEPFNVQATREVANKLTVPLAGGERLWSRHGFRQYLECGAMTLAQPDMGIAGGFTEVSKIAALADSYGAYLQPHNCGGPISTAACVNMSAAAPNFLIQEIFPYWADQRYDIVTEPYEADVMNGTLTPRQLPGLGVELNRDFLKRFSTLKTRAMV